MLFKLHQCHLPSFSVVTNLSEHLYFANPRRQVFANYRLLKSLFVAVYVQVLHIPGAKKKVRVCKILTLSHIKNTVFQQLILSWEKT